MKKINNYIVEKLKINKDVKSTDFTPEEGLKGLVLKVNLGGYNGKQLADVYPCEIHSVHANGKDFLVDYTNAPKLTPIYFEHIDNQNFRACSDDKKELYRFYDKDFSIKEIDKILDKKSKGYDFDDMLILIPNNVDNLEDWLKVLKLYLNEE